MLAPEYWERVEKTAGCWLWRGRFTDDGYGRFYTGGKYRRAHRLSYTDAHGEIPDGLQLDHLCRIRGCVNPDHLEPVTARVNVLRSDCPAAVNARKTHCPHGHAFDAANTWVDSAGKRKCRACRREAEKRRPARKRKVTQ